MLSSDGSYVVFSSLASNLDINDTNDQEDVWRYDVAGDVLERVTYTTVELSGKSDQPAVSFNGFDIAFRTTATNPPGGITDANGDQPRLHKVEFCDTVAELPAGAVTLARLYQSPIVGFAIVRLGPRKWRAIVDPPLEPPARRSGAAGDLETLQVLAHRWTALVLEYPDQWSASYDIAWLE